MASARGYVVGVDETPDEKEIFPATIVTLGGTVHGSKGRGYLYYTPFGRETAAPTQAWNAARVQERAGTPVLIGYDKGGPVILQLDRSRMEPNGAQGYRSPLFAQHSLDHVWSSGDPLYVDTRQIKDLMVRPAGEFIVKVSPGWYAYAGQELYFGGSSSFDLSSYQPAVAGTKRFVGLYIDSAGALQAVGGGTVAVTAILPEPVWPDNVFKLVAVILFGDKDFIDFEYIKQRKRIWTGSGSLPVATETVAGIIEIATQAETDAGTDDQRAVTPLKLANYPLALPCQGRLTLTTATPVTTSNVTAATTIYFTPHLGNRIAVYTGSYWKLYAFSELSLAVPSTIYRLFDIFVYDNAGTLTLEAVNWSQSTAAITGATNATPIVITSNGHGLANNDRVAIASVGGNTAANGIWSVANVTANTFELEGSAGSGAYTSGGTWYKLNETRATALATQDGIYVKSGAATRRYLGTGMTTGTSGQTEVTISNLLLYNYYNKVLRAFQAANSTNHTYTSATVRVYQGDNAAKVGYVQGVVEESVAIGFQADINFDAGDGAVNVGAVQNRTGTFNLLVTVRDVQDTRGIFDYGSFVPAAGYNFLQLTQSGAATSPDFRVAVARGQIFV